MTDNPIDAKLEATRQQIVALAEQMNAAQQTRNNVDKELREVRNKENKLNSERLEISNLIANVRQEMRRAEREIELQEKEKAKEAENRRVRAEFERLSVEFDGLIAQFEWGKTVLPHQVSAMKRAAIAHRMVLADKPGLGKTLTSIGWLDLIQAHKILAIVPNETMGNFLREMKRWAPHRSAHIIGGMPKAQVQPLLKFFSTYDGNILVIVNYESWRKNMQLIQWLADVQFDTVICDEAHMIKDMDSIAYRGVKELIAANNKCSKCGSDKIMLSWNIRCSSCGHTAQEYGEFRSIKNIMPMTGTPFLNAPADAFPLFHLVNPTLFPDKRQYLDTYCTKDWTNGKWKFLPGMEERLATKISGMYLARDRNAAGVILPKQDVVIHELDFDAEAYPKQWESYQILKQRSALVMKDLLSDGDNRGVFPVAAAIALITRQRQMMTWPDGITMRDSKTGQILFQCDVTESIKMDKIIDIKGEGLVPQIVNDEGDRMVVFSQFKTALAEMERRLSNAGFRVVRYDGDTPRSLRQEIQIDFDRATYKDNPSYTAKWDVVLCNYKTGGVGLNLNAATQVIVFDEEWNPGKEEQAFNRVDRIGQTEESIVHILRVRNSIDMWMVKIMQFKRDMLTGIETQIDLQQELTNILMEGSAS